MKSLKLLLLSLIVISCVPEAKRAKQKKIFESKVEIENTWGLPFQTSLINNENKSANSDAVAHIIHREGGTGTGFFISSDGLFLTNHHVISSDKCSAEFCKGIKIVRDFRIGGKNEVYTKLKLLTYNKTLDYALLKVDLEKEDKVSFIQIDNKYFTSSIEEEKQLQVIGHPFGSALRKSNAYYYGQEDQHILLKAVIINGNSGSPIINGENKAIALLWGASWDSSTVDMKGKVQHVVYTTPMDKIIENIKLSYNELTLNKEEGLSLGLLAPKNDYRDNRPKKVSELTVDDNFDFGTWANNYYGEKDGIKKLEELLNYQIEKQLRQTFVDKTKVESILSDFNNFERQLLTPLAISDMLIDTLKDFLSYDHQEHDYLLTPLLVKRGEIARDDCVQKINKKYKTHYSYALFFFGHYCHAKKVAEKNYTILWYSQFYTHHLNDKNELSQARINALISSIKNQLHLRRGKIDRYQNSKMDLLKAVQVLKSKTTNWRKFSQAESLEVLFSEQDLSERIYDWSDQD
ncbi:serine protease [bacterium]|nr:serine protease [bacterium]